jgi:hypothetical protein
VKYITKYWSFVGFWNSPIFDLINICPTFFLFVHLFWKLIFKADEMFSEITRCTCLKVNEFVFRSIYLVPSKINYDNVLINGCSLQTKIARLSQSCSFCLKLLFQCSFFFLCLIIFIMTNRVPESLYKFSSNILDCFQWDFLLYSWH